MLRTVSKTLSEKVYDAIVDRIIRGEINASTVLTEASLVESFQISKSPVREALVRLCHEEILVSIPRFGYKVQLVNKDYLEGIIRLRFNIEPKYLDIYFDKLTEEDFKRIRASIATLDKDVLSNPFAYWQATCAFHLALAFSYHDQFFYNTMQSILNKQLITFGQLYWNNWSDVADTKMIDNHTVVLDAIEAGHKEEAIKLLEADIKSF